MSRPSYDPRDKVDLTHVNKRGEWYTVRGVIKGLETSVEIPAPTIESKTRREAEALMRRSLYGTAQSEKGDA